MTIPPRTDDRRSRRPPFLLPTPSLRAATRAYLAACVVLLLETIYWLPQPCTGGGVCAPVVGAYTAVGLVPLAVSIAVWRFVGRASGAVVIATLIVGVTAPLLPSLLVAGNVIALALAAVPFLLAFGITGAAGDLLPHLGERIGTVVVLAGMAGWLTTDGGLVFALVPIIVAVLVALGVLRAAPRPAPLLETD
ncbi:MAG TPA: hypothetical protein VGC90_11005 [Candidatus Limnocylindrales bacterium]|jgi:hypothetical protein